MLLTQSLGIIALTLPSSQASLIAFVAAALLQPPKIILPLPISLLPLLRLHNNVSLLTQFGPLCPSRLLSSPRF